MLKDQWLSCFSKLLKCLLKSFMQSWEKLDVFLYLFLWCRIEYEDHQESLLRALKQNVGPTTQMVCVFTFKHRAMLNLWHSHWQNAARGRFIQTILFLLWLFHVIRWWWSSPVTGRTSMTASKSTCVWIVPLPASVCCPAHSADRRRSWLWQRRLLCRCPAKWEASSGVLKSR